MRRRRPSPALKHPSAGVRRNAVQVLPRDAGRGRGHPGRGPAAGRRCPGPAGGAAGAGRHAAPSDGGHGARRRVSTDAARHQRPLAARRGHGAAAAHDGAFLRAVAGRRSSVSERRHTRRAASSPSITPAAARPTSVGTAARVTGRGEPRSRRARVLAGPGRAAGRRTSRPHSTQRPKKPWPRCCRKLPPAGRGQLVHAGHALGQQGAREARRGDRRRAAGQARRRKGRRDDASRCRRGRS